MKRFNNRGTANRKNRRAIPAKRDRSRNMKTSGKAPTFTYTCKRRNKHTRAHPRIYIYARGHFTPPHIRTASSRTSEKKPGASFTFLFRALLFSLPLPSSLRLPVNERARNQPPPRATHPCHRGGSHWRRYFTFTKHPPPLPRCVLLTSSNSPGVSLEGVQNVRAAYGVCVSVVLI